MYDKAHYFAVQNKGYLILLGIMTVEWPKQFLDQIFHKILDAFLGKIREA